MGSSFEKLGKSTSHITKMINLLVSSLARNHGFVVHIHFALVSIFYFLQSSGQVIEAKQDTIWAYKLWPMELYT